MTKINMKIENDFSVEEILESFDDDDICELLTILKKKGHIPQFCCEENQYIPENNWNDVLLNLKNNRLKISLEDEEIIKKISKKY